MTIRLCCVESNQVYIKVIAGVNLLWILFLLSLEIILVYEVGEKGLQDVIPALSGNDLGHNRTTHCSYHVYRKYACKRIVNSESHSSNNFINFHMFLPLLWFLVCMLDSVLSLVLYNAARKNRRGGTLTWLIFATGILLFQSTIIFMCLAAGFSIISEIPLICFCVFRIFSLCVVYEFYTTLTQKGLNHRKMEVLSNSIRKISITLKKEKMEDDVSGESNGNGNIKFGNSLSPNDVTINNMANNKNSDGITTSLRKISIKVGEPLPLLVFK